MNQAQCFAESHTPCRLAPKGAAEEEFELSVTGELEVSPTLLQMLKADLGTPGDQRGLD